MNSLIRHIAHSIHDITSMTWMNIRLKGENINIFNIITCINKHKKNAANILYYTKVINFMIWKISLLNVILPLFLSGLGFVSGPDLTAVFEDLDNLLSVKNSLW